MNFARFFDDNDYYCDYSPPVFLRTGEGSSKGSIYGESLQQGSPCVEELSVATKKALSLFKADNSAWIFFEVGFFPQRMMLIACPDTFSIIPYLEYLQKLLISYVCGFCSNKGDGRDHAFKEHEHLFMLRQAQLTFGIQDYTETVGWVHPKEELVCVLHGFSSSETVINQIIAPNASSYHYSVGNAHCAREYLRSRFLANIGDIAAKMNMFG